MALVDTMGGYWSGWHDSGLRVELSAVVRQLLDVTLPSISSARYVNLGVSIVVHFDTGPVRANGRLGHSHLDWIGLYRKGECDGENLHDADHWAKVDRHKCWLRLYNVPRDTPKGHVTFDFETYNEIGDYEARYFYGDDPTAPEAFSWRAQGWACTTWSNPTRPPTVVCAPLVGSYVTLRIHVI